MVDPILVEKVRELLRRDELSNRAIARQIGMSKGTVNVIANGDYPDYPARATVKAELEDEYQPVRKPYPRCTGCGALLKVIPCVGCSINKGKELSR